MRLFGTRLFGARLYSVRLFGVEVAVPELVATLIRRIRRRHFR